MVKKSIVQNKLKFKKTAEMLSQWMYRNAFFAAKSRVSLIFQKKTTTTTPPPETKTFTHRLVSLKKGVLATISFTDLQTKCST
jgi:hypothetical protein